MFSFLKKKFLNKKQQQQIIDAIKQAELATNGEIRLYVEGNCNTSTALERAIEMFGLLKMEQTKQHNAVLLYIAFKDKKVAIYGDAGIHKIVGQAFWNSTIEALTAEFKSHHIEQGIIAAITDIGEKLKQYFPYTADDTNELPNTIVFGK